MLSSKSIIRSIVVVSIFGASMPSWALWTHAAGGAKWSFTYTGEDNKFAVVNGVVEAYSSSLSVPAIVQHDNSTNTNKWPVVRVNLNPTITNIRDVVTSISIPHSVTNVAASCFDRYINMRSAIWQTDQTASIGNYAFASCSNLVSVTLPADKLGMGIGVFKDCVRLPTVSLPKTLSSIGDATFRNCTSLSSVEIPEAAVAIGDSAFQGCTTLAAIRIPQSVTSIGEYAFYGCASLKCVIIPAHVASIGGYAFANCAGLKKALVPASLKGNLGKVRGKETAFSDMSIVEYYDGDTLQGVLTSAGVALLVSKVWIDDKASTFLADAAGDYEKAANAVSANGMKVWECYVAGIDPSDPESRFVVEIEMKDGLPSITWKPNLNADEETRIYTIYGNETLDEAGWTSPTNSLHRFFKISVELL